jgi:hypothetical protein
VYFKVASKSNQRNFAPAADSVFGAAVRLLPGDGIPAPARAPRGEADVRVVKRVGGRRRVNREIVAEPEDDRDISDTEPDSSDDGPDSGDGAHTDDGRRDAANDAAPTRKVPRDAIEYGCGYFKLRVDYDSVDSHCAVCGVKFDKSVQPYGGLGAAIIRPKPMAPGKNAAQGRPMGFHCAFLEHCPGTAAEHKALVISWRDMENKAYDLRSRARVQGLQDPSLAACFAAEDSGDHRVRRGHDGHAVPADGPDGEPYDMC